MLPRKRMRHKFLGYFASRGRKGIAIPIAVLLLASSGQSQPLPPLDGPAIRAAVEQALAAAPRGFQRLQSPVQAGVRVLGVDVSETPPGTRRITIDLSQKALTYDPTGDVEVITDHVLASTARLTAGARDVEYRLLVEGVPLDQFLPRAAPARRSASRAVGAPGRVVISAGHGWYRDEVSNTWKLQRDYYWGIVEDFVNYDIVTYLLSELRAANLDVRPARQPDRAAGIGTSGHARWEESAKYHIREIGAPASVWDYGVDDYSKDINSRPFYANWIDSAVVVAIHNNGGGGSGTETWYDTTNAFEAESRRLAEILNRRIVAALRARYDANWPDRGLRTCNACKGENHWASRPAVIVEVAFMDTRTPDNDALHDETFKRIVAQAVREGLQEFGLAAAPAVEDPDGTARREIVTRVAYDERFGAAIDGSFGVDINWDSRFELRWLDISVSGSRRVRVFHATARANRTVRYIGFWDPDTGAWIGWDRIS
jgi:N-acetylmuramoyl-L-alanine amidase